MASDDLNQTLAGLAPVTPKTAPEGTSSASARQLMNSAKLIHLPVVDDRGRPVGLFHISRMEAPILLSAPHMGEEERELVVEAFDTNWIAPVGPHVDSFERELAELVIDLTGSSSKLINKPLPADDPTQRCPDITLAKAELDWEPSISLAQGLEKTIPYFEGLLQK